MKHFDDGALRRLLDEPGAFSPAERGHADACESCSRRLASVAADRQFSLERMAISAHATSLVQARARIANGKSARQPMFAHRLARRRAPRLTLASVLVIAVALATTVATGAGQALLTVFQPSQVVPVFIQRGEFVGLPNLRHFGTLTPPAKLSAKQLLSKTAAEKASGLSIVDPGYLPSGITHRRLYEILPAESASFKFSSSKVAQYIKDSHKSVPALPKSIDGTVLTLRTNVAAVTMFGAVKGEIPQLVIGQSAAPSLVVSGASLRTIESYLSGVPGVPKGVVTQLEALSNPNTVLPIPIPVNWGAYGERVTIQGSPGVAVGDDTGVASVVVWEKNGVVYGVGGTLTKSQVIQIANSLR